MVAVEGPGRARRGWRELLTGKKGAVMGEAVIMLPALILIWSIILYIHFGFRDAQRNQVTLRDEAWVHAYGGCNSTANDPTVIDDGGQFDGESAGGGMGDLAGVLRLLTTTLFMIDEFGANREVSVTRPNQLGGGTRTMSWGMLMLCNEDQRGDDETPWYEAVLDFFGGV
jgi:hypothetical protein